MAGDTSERDAGDNNSETAEEITDGLDTVELLIEPQEC
jgi:hypothetical protein